MFYNIVLLFNVSTYKHVSRNHLDREEVVWKTILKFKKYLVVVTFD